MKLDKERVQYALNRFADNLRSRGHEDLAFMIENYDVLLKEEFQAEQPDVLIKEEFEPEQHNVLIKEEFEAPKPKKRRNKL